MNRIDRNSILPNAIATLVGLGVILFVFFVKNVFQGNIPECTQLDLYDIQAMERGGCTPQGIQKRNLLIKDHYDCKNPNKVTVPELSQRCEYVPQCVSSDRSISDWSLCIGSSQTRIVEKISRCESGYIPEKIQSCTKMSVKLFQQGIKEYTTRIENGTYSKDNYDNLSIKVQGKLKNATIVIVADTSYKIPEYYYIFFGIDVVHASPRVLGTSRIQSNRLDLQDYGVFQGNETPKKMSFDLSNTKLANESKSIGSSIKNYVDYMNNNANKELKMSLYIADGRSMTTEEEGKRIYGTIKDAAIEYECEDGSECSIERIPLLNN